MNIEQLAQEVDYELCVEGIDVEANEFPTEFLRRCLSKLSKLAEQTGEPVAWRYKYRFKDIGETGAYEYHSHDFVVVTRFPKGDPLYTESQLIAAQQRTAEACTKACDGIADEAWSKGEVQFANRCAAAIRNGEWRKHL